MKRNVVRSGIVPVLAALLTSSWLPLPAAEAPAPVTLRESDRTFFLDNGATSMQSSVTYGSSWPGGHVQGETYTRMRIEVLPEFEGFSAIFGFSGDFNVVNGVQIVPVPAPASALPALAATLMLARRRRSGLTQ